MIRVDVVPIPIESLPSSVQAAVGPEAPTERRLTIARAVVPMEPVDLLAVLAFLSSDRNEDVARAARESIDNIPWNVLSQAVRIHANPGVLDRLARAHGQRQGLLELVIANRTTADQTVAFIAGSAKGPVLDQIAANQARISRFPRIVEGLYYNSETRMGTVSIVLENAVRMGIDLSHIPGYLEIVESILGPDAARRLKAKQAFVAPVGEEMAPLPEEPPPEAPEAPEAPPDDGRPVTTIVLGEEIVEEGLDEESFTGLIADGEDSEIPEEVDPDAEPDVDKSAALWKKVARMSIAQKVRAALLGSGEVRALLIRDTRRLVYMSVLKSPRLNDKEVILYARSRNLNEEIIRSIAFNRDWTKNYAVRQALAGNPKCPPNQAMTFLRTLLNRDVKHLSQSKDVPGFIARNAKQLLQLREEGKSR